MEGFNNIIQYKVIHRGSKEIVAEYLSFSEAFGYCSSLYYMVRM